METWQPATATGPHGAGRRRSHRPWAASAAAAAGGVMAGTPGSMAEVKEASSSPYWARRGQRAPFAPAFPGVGVAPTLVVPRLPEMASPQQGAPDVFPLASHRGGSPSGGGHSHHSHPQGHGGYDSDASTVLSDMEAEDEDDDEDDEDGPPPPMPCAFGRTQRVYVEREEEGGNGMRGDEMDGGMYVHGGEEDGDGAEEGDGGSEETNMQQLAPLGALS